MKPTTLYYLSGMQFADFTEMLRVYKTNPDNDSMERALDELVNLNPFPKQEKFVLQIDPTNTDMRDHTNFKPAPYVGDKYELIVPDQKYYFWDDEMEEGEEVYELVNTGAEYDLMYKIIQEHRAELTSKWAKLKPFTAKEILKTFKDNSEKLFFAIKELGPENLATQLDVEVIDEQTITKTREKVDIKNLEGAPTALKSVSLSGLEIGSETYEDTYKLMRIKKEKFGEGLENDVYMVGCKDTSTPRMYYLFVDGRDSRWNKDAIAAIASTMLIPENLGDANAPLVPMTKEQYLEMVAES